MNLINAIINDNVEAAETILLQELKKDPQNINLWIKLSLTELQFPFEDYVTALKYLNYVYKLSPDNINALILEAGIKWHNLGFIDEELFARLNKVLIKDNQKMAIIYYLRSLYYIDFSNHSKSDKGDNEKLNLEKSIMLCSKFVYPYKRLGQIFLSELKTKESKEMFKTALSNIEKVYEEDSFYDFTDLDVYIAEFITGTKISYINYKSIKELAES